MAVYPFKDCVPKLGDKVFVAPTASVVGDVKIGAGSSIWFGSVVRGDVNKVTIGELSNVQDNATIHCQSDCPTEIGDHVMIGHNAVVHCKKIGNNCLVGMGAIIMGYSEIGDNCIIGANSFINQHKKIPSGSLMYGNPAKLVRPLRDDEIEALQESANNYSKLGQIYAEILGEQAKD